VIAFAVLLLELKSMTGMMSLQVYDHKGHIILAVVVGATFVRYLGCNLPKRKALSTKFTDHVGNLLFVVNQVEAVG
jgi:hypothetical protein